MAEIIVKKLEVSGNVEDIPELNKYADDSEIEWMDLFFNDVLIEKISDKSFK
jgi:hypothetical protein